MDAVCTCSELFLYRAPWPSLGAAVQLPRGPRCPKNHFADFAIDRSACELRRDGAVVHLQRIPMELLFLLVERRGQLVTREEIRESLGQGRLRRCQQRDQHRDPENPPGAG